MATPQDPPWGSGPDAEDPGRSGSVKGGIRERRGISRRGAGSGEGDALSSPVPGESSSPPKDQPHRCNFCSRWFKNRNALVAHLLACPERWHPRLFEVGQFQFQLRMNPTRKIMRSLRKLLIEHPDDPKLFLGAVMFLENTGRVKSYKVTELKGK